MERLIYTRVEPIVDPLLPQEQAGFRRGRLTVYQSTSLHKKLRTVFNEKEGRRYVCRPYSSLRYWLASQPHLQTPTPPTNRHMVSFIMKLIRNRNFTLTIGNGPQSRLRRLRNGVPQESVLAPILFNIHMHDLLTTTSKKFAYADDLAIMHSAPKWQILEDTLNQDMATLSTYLQKWKLKISSLSLKQWQKLSISTTRKPDMK